MKTSAAFCIVGYDVAVTEEFVFVSNQTFESNRATCVKFTGADTDFGTEAITETIGKAGRTIHVTAGRINQLHKVFRCCAVFRNNAVGMMGTVVVDVTDCFVDIIYNLDGKNKYYLNKILCFLEKIPTIYCGKRRKEVMFNAFRLAETYIAGLSRYGGMYPFQFRLQFFLSVLS